MGWKKPSWVQKVQTAASKAVEPVAKPIVRAGDAIAKATGLDKVNIPSPPPVAKALQNVQTAVQKGADKVGDVVRPAAQAVAKEVGYAVNPIIGEVGLRAKQIAEDPNVKKVSDKIGDAIREIPKPNIAPLKSQSSGGQFLPGLQQAGRGVVSAIEGVGDIIASPSDGNFMKGVYKIGDGFMDVVEPAGKSILGLMPRRGGRTDEEGGGGGRSGGAAVREIPRAEEDTDDIPPAGAKSNSTIGVPDKPPDRPLPPVEVIGSYLTGQQARPKIAAMKMPKRFKARRR